MLKQKIKLVIILVTTLFCVSFFVVSKAAGSDLSGYKIYFEVPHLYVSSPTGSGSTVNINGGAQSVYNGHKYKLVSQGADANSISGKAVPVDVFGGSSGKSVKAEDYYKLSLTKDGKTTTLTGEAARQGLINMESKGTLPSEQSSGNSSSLNNNQQPSTPDEKCGHVTPGEEDKVNKDREDYFQVWGNKNVCERTSETGQSPTCSENEKDLNGDKVTAGAKRETVINYKLRMLEKGHTTKKNSGKLTDYESKPHKGAQTKSNYDFANENNGGSIKRWTSGGNNIPISIQLTDIALHNKMHEYPAQVSYDANVAPQVQPGVYAIGTVVCDKDKKPTKVVSVGEKACDFKPLTGQDLDSWQKAGKYGPNCENPTEPPKKEDQKKKEEPKKNPPSASPSSSSKPFDDKINNPQNNPQGGNQNGGGQQPQGGGSPGGGQQPNQQNQYQSPYPSYYPYYSPTPYGYTPYPSYYPTPTPYSCPNEETAVCLKTGDSACVSLDEIIVSSPTPSPSSSPSASPETSASPSASPSPTPTNGINADDISYFGPCVDWGSADKTDMMNQIASLITKAVGSDSGLFSSIDKIPESVLNAIVKAISGIIGQMMGKAL